MISEGQALKPLALELHRHGWPISAIATLMERSPNTIRRYVDPAYHERAKAAVRAYKARRNAKQHCRRCSGRVHYQAVSGLCRRCSAQNQRKWTREAVIAAFQAFHAEHGRAPRALADQGHGRESASNPHTHTSWLPCNGTVAHLFGGWNQALLAAGLRPAYKTRGKRVTDAESHHIARMRLEGHSISAIAIHHNRSETTIYNHLRRHHIPPR